jgi:hypothetical protein
MLLPFVLTVLLCAAGAWVVAKTALTVAARLELDPAGVAIYLGLAERPVHQPRRQRRRLGELLER